jgi:WD40 repeat protein
MMRADSNQQIDSLQAQIKETSEAETERKTQEALLLGAPLEEEVEVLPILTLDAPTKLVVSTSGTMLAYVSNDDYVAKNSTGKSVQLPGINIEPSQSTLKLSPLGTRLAIISEDRGRIISLQTELPPVQLRGDFENPVAISVSENDIAISFADMSMLLIGTQNKKARALSSSGNFEVISFSNSGEQIVAATDVWLYVWQTDVFPKNVHTLKGVQNPCCVGAFKNRVVAVSSDGEVCIHEPNTESKYISIGVDADITYASLNIETTMLGCIANGTAYICTLATQERTEITWMPETPVGIAIGSDNNVILWSADGKIYSER